jgi:malonyl-CoA/methylmalonyl-CoA synthetase
MAPTPATAPDALDRPTPAAPANQNLFATLRAAFPGDLDRMALETADAGQPVLRYSWRDIDDATAMLAALLRSLDLPEGARVAAFVEKSVEAMLLYLATLRAGYVYLPLNTAYQGAEIEYFITDAQPSVLVCSSRNFAWVSRIAFSAGVRYCFTLDEDRSGSLLQRAVALPRTGAGQEIAPKAADDLAAILYTSGTTGRSKGAMLTHGNLASNALTLRAYWGWRADDRLIHALPIFHVHGLFVAIHGALLAGARMIWFSRFDAKQVLARLPEATLFMGVPTLYVRMLAEPGLTPQAAANMRLFVAGSAPLLVETFRAWRERTGHTILERYGMSERGGTVGFPLPGVSLRVRDEQGGDPGAGEIGGIEVKGPNVFKGYWRMPEKTLEEFTADGYFRTGDVGRIDERGYVSIVGRSKDLIISGGYNVYPAEVESFINELPGVLESALVGVPHPDFGEAGVAVLIARPGAALQGEAILQQLKAALANFKVPKRCFVVDELPRNSMGKVQKKLLRERYRGLFA